MIRLMVVDVKYTARHALRLRCRAGPAQRYESQWAVSSHLAAARVSAFIIAREAALSASPMRRRRGVWITEISIPPHCAESDQRSTTASAATV